MLGTKTGRTVEDYTSGREYAAYLFGGIKGNIAYCVKRGEYMEHTYYRASGTQKAEYTGIADCYISMNTFTKNSRKTGDVKRLINLYVDLDIYKSDYSDMPKEAIVQLLRDEYFGRLLPEPTFVIDSGNGLYLVWHLRNEDRNAMPRYLAILRYIIDTLKDFGADPACSDASRILRVPGTVNSKCGRTVRILSFSDVAYSIHEIQQEYGIKPCTRRTRRTEGAVHPYGTATEKMRLLAAKIAADKGIPAPDFENYEDTFRFIGQNMGAAEKTPVRAVREKLVRLSDVRQRSALLKDYIHDIETVMLSRKGADCKREYALFLYRLFMQELTGRPDTALKRTLALNAALDKPLAEKYVMVRTYSAQRKIDSGDTYHYKKNTIINALEITQEEMEKLCLYVLTDRQDPKERKARANRRAYDKRLAESGRERKRDSVKSRREQIAAMRKQGIDAEAIIAALKISKATYYRDVAATATEDGLEACTRAVSGAVEKVAANAREAAGNMKQAVLTALTAATGGDSQKLSQSIIGDVRSTSARPVITSIQIWPISGSGEDGGMGGSDGGGLPPPVIA